jgi:hypothetical protein
LTDSPDKATRIRKFVTAALLAALLCLSTSAQPQTITGKVVGVSDGDLANHRQSEQQDLSHVELPGLLEGVGAQPNPVQD